MPTDVTSTLNLDTLSRAQRRWVEIVHDASLQDLPYKVETNVYGQLILSPASYDHSRMQIKLGRLLEDYAEEASLEGEASAETAIEVQPGQVKVPDVAWISSERLAQRGEGYALTVMPEIVVEILSPGNDEAEMAEKRDLYLKAGAVDGSTAQEVWLVSLNGRVRFYDADGPRDQSHFLEAFPREISGS